MALFTMDGTSFHITEISDDRLTKEILWRLNRMGFNFDSPEIKNQFVSERLKLVTLEECPGYYWLFLDNDKLVYSWRVV